MKKAVHPKMNNIKMKCSCGNEFYLFLVLSNNVLDIDVCNKCYPFYTGKEKIVDIAGRVDNFNKKFKKLKKRQK